MIVDILTCAITIIGQTKGIGLDDAQGCGNAPSRFSLSMLECEISK